MYINGWRKKIKHNLFRCLVIFNNAIWFNTKTYFDNNDPLDCIAGRQKEMGESVYNLFIIPRNSYWITIRKFDLEYDVEKICCRTSETKMCLYMEKGLSRHRYLH